MFPVYKDMNSYPSQRNHMPSTQYYYPSWEAASPHSKDDKSSSSCAHECWPHSYGYPMPMQCHNCCSHGQHPAYYSFRPPCSHVSPPPPLPYPHYYSGYPPYPQPYPMYYAPPPHYSMDLPRYEYDKNVPRDQYHCCGCSNHPCHMKGRNNVKIEEHEPDVDMKKNEPSCPAVANNNLPYPLLWIPPEYAMNKEQPKRLTEKEVNQQHDVPNVNQPQVQQIPVETETKGTDGFPLEGKPNQSVQSAELDPNSRYGWFPLDINKIKRLMEGGNDQEIRDKDDNQAHDVENKGRNKQIQVGKTDGGMAESPACNAVQSKIEHSGSEAEKQRDATGDDDSSTGAAEVEKKRRVRTIPVKQLEDTTSKSSNKEEGCKQDAAKNVSNMQSSSTNKKSKLPPICLKVDPPKKKTVGGSSRPSSPPDDKKQQDSDVSSSKMKYKQPQKEVEAKDAEDKTPNQHKVEVSHGEAENQHESKSLKDHTDGSKEKVEKQADVETGDCRMQAKEPLAAKEGGFQQERKQEKRVLSETEAATIIQTAYRGHDVRRSEPIKKLKQIAEVQKEAIQLKKHLEDFESRGVIDEKERAATGETIMKQLLKLDAIQGLHQSIRDFRRSMAKELIILQEKLDSIMTRKPDNFASQAVEQTSTGSGLVEEPSKDSGLDEEPSKDSVLAEKPSNVSVLVDEPSKDSGLVKGSEVTVNAGDAIKVSSLDGDKSAKESGKGILSSSELSTEPLPCQGIVCPPEDKETLEPAVVNTESQRQPHDDVMVSSVESEDVAPAGLGLDMEESHQTSETVQDKSPKESQQSVVEKISIEDLQNDMGFENNDQEGNLLFELPHEVVEDSLATMGRTEDMAAQNDLLTGNKDQEGQNDMVAGDEDQEADFLSDLPRDVEDDEKTIQLTECNWGSSDLASSNNSCPASKVERIEQDVDEELSHVQISGSLNKDQVMDHPNESLEVENEEDNVVVIKNENHEPLDLSSKETPSGKEANEGGSEVQESADAEVEKVGEIPLTEGRSETSNAECSGRTFSLPDGGDQIKRSETVEQEFLNEEDGSSELSFESRSSVAVAEKDEQTDKKILEENEKLREMLEKLLAAGKEQQEVISSLNGKVKDLEKKLGRKKRVKSAKQPRVRVARPLCGKPASGSLGERPMDIVS